MDHPVISPKKLIEVALPLDAINAAAAREKSIRHGHPSTLHLWWARRPLAAARAVIFSQLVHDPEDLWRCQNPGKEPNAQVKGHWTKARARLFSIIEDLVKWENTTNEQVLEKAREEIRRSWRETCELNHDHPDAETLFNPEKMPGLHDPFAGGGAIPLEAQRLGLEAFASDLNPVAVLINKAMIEIPPKFAGRPPVCLTQRHNDTEGKRRKKSGKGNGGSRLIPHLCDSMPLNEQFPGAKGLAEDVRYYGQWMRDEAFKRIGHLYPPIEITEEMVKERPDLEPYAGEKLTVIAWLWARTVKSPNPAFSDIDVPLASTFILSSKPGKEAYVQPVFETSTSPQRTQGISAEIGSQSASLTSASSLYPYRFTVKVGKPPAEAKSGTSAGARKGFRCLMSNIPIAFEYIREEGLGSRMSQKLMAIVAEGSRGRVYLAPTADHETIARSAQPTWEPETPIPEQALSIRVQLYGMKTHGKLFTPRQLVALTTFSDLVGEARERIRRDAVAAGLPDDDTPLDACGTGARAYAEAVSVYLAFAADKCADRGSRLCRWDPTPTQSGIVATFSRQALPMTWDFAEANPLGDASGNYLSSLDLVIKSFMNFPCNGSASVGTENAANQKISRLQYVSTDPPYYDNIGYADLSDFFYVWLRRCLRPVFPNLLATIAVPKTEELVATPYRHGTKQKAEKFFLDGMTQAMHNLAVQAHLSAPITIYYAFKQSETESDGTTSSGWVTFLEAVLKSGFALTGTWPMRTELGNRMISSGTNSLASSIILVCRPRAKDAGTIDRRKFQRMLNEVLPEALAKMTSRGDAETQREDKKKSFDLRASAPLRGMNDSPVAPVDLSQAIIGPGMAIFSRYDSVLEANGTPMTVKTALQLINRFLAEDDFDADTQFCLHWFEQYGWETGKFGEADTLARAKGTSVDGVKNAGALHSAGGNVRLLKCAEYPIDWDPQADQRLPIWEVLHQLIRVFNTDGETGAAAVFAAVQSNAEAARQLAYRLYTLCERKNWAEDARAYNEVVTSWSGIESAAAKEPTLKQGELFQ